MFKLMIVDDELLMRMGIRSMVDWESHGFVLAGEASNGKEALDLALQVEPDLIITDIKMPLMDGLQLIREATKSLIGCKFAILTYFNEFGYAKEALQLGAVDYLIKSEITPAGIIQLLEDVRQRLREDKAQSELIDRLPDYSESLSHLKENLFKEMISGLLEAGEAALKAEQLQVRVRSNELAVVKFCIDFFEEIRKKYVEKDEKLLRFSVLNILEEIIPGRWNKEIVIESSSEYLLILNTPQPDIDSARAELEQLCGDIQQAMMDFMNITFSVGISSVVRDLSCLKAAYREADRALRRRFYSGTGRILFFEEDEAGPSKEEPTFILSEEWERAFRNAVKSNHEAKWIKILDDFRRKLADEQAAERDIRESYIRLTEIIGSEVSYACRTRLHQTDISPYKAMLSAETWDEVHRIVCDYAAQCVAADHQLPGKSYADMAVDLIRRFYAEDISLISVAGQINVNPSYLSRVFKQEKGENFVSFLTRVRIEQAKSYLESRKYKVSEVADKVGYHNYPYFSKLFKKYVGISPEEYRG